VANQISNKVSVLLNNVTLPLPVELVSFSASVSGSSVNLSWNTAIEVNNYGFKVERKILNPSAKGGQNDNNNWETLGL